MNDEQKDLPTLFDEAFETITRLDESTDSSSSDAFQEQVQDSIASLETATQLVNKLCLFSMNESLQDVMTSHIRYLLLPALLGHLSLKRSTSNALDRLEVLNVASVYYKDFLQRCKEYGLFDDGRRDDDDTDTQEQHHTPLVEKLLEEGKDRQRKIDSYNERKSLQEKYRDLQRMIKQGSDDDETKRDFYITLLKYWINCVKDDLPTVEEEVRIVKFMTERAKEGKKDVPEPVPKKTPLKPFIITRSEQQKKVYGLGYPSVPVMTVDEFVAKRYPEGSEGPNEAAMASLQAWAQDPEKAKQDQEREEEEKEKKEEVDDPELLQYKRDFDDWKDHHKRGEGNRINMG